MSELTTRNYVFDEPVEGGRAVLPKGEYPFTILEINAIEISKAGNQVLPLKLEFTGTAGETATVYEKLVFTQAAKWKIDSFLKCTLGGAMTPGKSVNFDDPRFVAWLEKNGKGRAKLKIETYTAKDGTAKERNAVESFLWESTKLNGTTVTAPPPARVPEPQQVASLSDDEIPF
jgi:hypothetical protein